MTLPNSLKPKIALICCLPLLWLMFDTVTSNLGSNPIQGLHYRLGSWSLRFLCITLAVTPVQTITGCKDLSEYRPLFGMIAFGYGTLHVLAYLAADHFFAWDVIAIDIIQSPYIWFGILAYLIILALALTSSKAVKKCMGPHWKKLHRSVYLAVGAALLHYSLQLKGNLAEPLFYGVIVALLLAARVVFLNISRRRNLWP